MQDGNKDEGIKQAVNIGVPKTNKQEFILTITNLKESHTNANIKTTINEIENGRYNVEVFAKTN